MTTARGAERLSEALILRDEVVDAADGVERWGAPVAATAVPAEVAPVAFPALADYEFRPAKTERRAPDLKVVAAAAFAAALAAGAGFYYWRVNAERVGGAPTARAHSGPRPAARPALASPFGFGEPAPGYSIISPFGLRQLPWEAAPRLHAGGDIAAPLGTEVRAVARGIVERSGFAAGYGRFVEVRHAAGLRSFYAHLGAIAADLQPGKAVAAGAVLGEVGSTGASTGAHLHFELRDAKGRPLDPAAFLSRNFASVADWPIEAAARIPKTVRIAVVSSVPESILELMIAREEARAFATGRGLAQQIDAARAVAEPVLTAAPVPPVIEPPAAVVLPQPAPSDPAGAAPPAAPDPAARPRSRAAFPSNF